jgi:hypothetical protein
LEGFVENTVSGDECRNYIAKAIGNVIVVNSALPRYRELVGAVPVASGIVISSLYRFIYRTT